MTCTLQGLSAGASTVGRWVHSRSCSICAAKGVACTQGFVCTRCLTAKLTTYLLVQIILFNPRRNAAASSSRLGPSEPRQAAHSQGAVPAHNADMAATSKASEQQQQQQQQQPQAPAQPAAAQQLRSHLSEAPAPQQAAVDNGQPPSQSPSQSQPQPRPQLSQVRAMAAGQLQPQLQPSQQQNGLGHGHQQQGSHPSSQSQRQQVTDTPDTWQSPGLPGLGQPAQQAPSSAQAMAGGPLWLFQACLTRHAVGFYLPVCLPCGAGVLELQLCFSAEQALKWARAAHNISACRSAQRLCSQARPGAAGCQPGPVCPDEWHITCPRDPPAALWPASWGLPPAQRAAAAQPASPPRHALQLE